MVVVHSTEMVMFGLLTLASGKRSQNEFIFSPRVDNLFSSFAAVQALVASSQSSAPSDGRVSMIALFDNEEVGSVSAYGAESNFIESVFERVAVALKDENESEAEAFQRTMASSFLLSYVSRLEALHRHLDESDAGLTCYRTDVGHSVHPGFVDKHEENHRPLINAGIAIKSNSKQRYATTSQTVFPLRRVAAEAKVPLQEYLVRNDMGCGSTSAFPPLPPFMSAQLSSLPNAQLIRPPRQPVGPLVSKIGLRTVDIGAPILSMHSYGDFSSPDLPSLELTLSFFPGSAKWPACAIWPI